MAVQEAQKTVPIWRMYQNLRPRDLFAAKLRKRNEKVHCEARKVAFGGASLNVFVKPDEQCSAHHEDVSPEFHCFHF